MSRIIGIDIGEKRVGLALSDETKTIASGLDVIAVKSIGDVIGRLKDIAAEYNAEKIVVGLPLNMDGSIGEAAQKAMDFIELLRQGISIPAVTFDERLTTKQAEAALLAADMSRKKRRKNIDKVSAQIMLQAYLDSRKAGATTEKEPLPPPNPKR